MAEQVKTTAIVEVPVVEKAKFDIKNYVPLIVMLIGMLGNLLTTQFGFEPLPFSEGQMTEFLTTAIAVFGGIWSWFRNNNVTKIGQQRQAVADQAVPKK